MKEITTHLLRIELDNIHVYLEGGMDAWQVRGYPVSTLETISVHTLKERLDYVTVLDARTEKEWNAGHIAGAIHIHGGKLQENFELVPRDKPVAVVCGSAYRGSIASFLQREGYENVSNVLGGMSAWGAAEFPMEQSTGGDNSRCRASATA